MSSEAAPAAEETWTHARSTLMLTVREHGENSPQADAARANYKARRLAHHIEGILASALPLTTEQRTRLAELLRPPMSGAEKLGQISTDVA